MKKLTVFIFTLAFIFCGTAYADTDADYNGDGVIDRSDVRKKRKDNDKAFKLWKKECWKTEEKCGDYNGDGVTDKKDRKEKKADLKRSLKTWKKKYWEPEMKLQSSRENNLGKKAEVSGCGGFDAEERTLEYEDENCKDERLSWKYDEASKTVTFLNGNVWLNCCGEHSATISLNEKTGVYQIYETDRPDDVGRCHCMCFFDFQVSLPDVEPEKIKVKISRFISDSDSSMSAVWKGELDLGDGSGEKVIQENVGWCDE